MYLISCLRARVGYLHRVMTELDEAAIERLVRQFYGQVRSDPMLGPVFAHAIGEDDDAWEAHFARLTDFWTSVMLRSGRYHGDPFSVHLRLPDITPAMFERWLGVFHATSAALFTADIAAEFGEKAERIARSLKMGLFERLPGIASSPVNVRVA